MPFQTPPPDKVTIVADKASARVGTSVVWEGNVVVRYGSTKVTADRVVADEGRERGTAEGHVVLIDPAGTINADRVEFGWNPARRTGSADNVSIRVGNGILRARRLEYGPAEWNLYDAEGTTCFRGTPVYYVTSDHVSVSPGKQATIHQPHISFLGKYIATAPTQRASLIQAVPGVHYPAPTYNPKRGFGLSFNGGVVAGRDSVLNFNSGLFYRRQPSVFAQYTHSFVPLPKATQVVAPRSDFAERSSYGFFTSLATASPEEESRYLRTDKSALSFAGQLRGGVADRDRGTHYGKVEGIFETGGAEDSIGYLGQIRVQGIQREFQSMEPRIKLVGAAGPPVARLTSRLEAITRLDSELFLGRTAYGWGEVTSGLSYKPTEWLRLSGAAFFSGDAGTPQFGMDPLFAKRGVVGRSDLQFGGLTFSYLIKRDFGRGVYDHEFNLRQVIGCFEAFYSKREFPRDRHIGITIRVQPFVDLFKRRLAEVTGKPVPETAKR